MSGMDERAKQFRTVAESQLKGDALVKEINTLRRFLFRNQEYRFTKSAQMSLYSAILAHHANAAAFDSSTQEAPILRLLDDALKMPFTVFTSAQKDKLLALYWPLLGDDTRSGSAALPPCSSSTRTTVASLILIDIEEGNPPNLVLMREDGTEYAHAVAAPTADAAAVREAFDAGKEVRVTVEEAIDGGAPSVVDVEISDDA